MSDVFYLRPVDPPVSPGDVAQMAKYSGSCFNLHKVDWRHSFLALDGARMLCWYRAPDAESVRVALRQLGSDMNAVWSGYLLPDDARGRPDIDAVNAIAEISFDEPVRVDDSTLLPRLEPLLEERSDVRLVLGLISSSGMRLACLLQAEDATGALAVLERAALPVRRVWACRTLTPGAAASS